MLKRITKLLLASTLLISMAIPVSAAEPDTVVPEELQISKLYTVLSSEYISTPDGFAIHPDGDLVFACPNFGDQKKPGTIARIDQKGKVSKWFDVPVEESSGVARPMGIDFDKDGNMYIVDNQGWTGNPESVNKGRILKVEFKDDMPEKVTEVAVGMEHPNGIKIYKDNIYVTQSSLSNVDDPSGLLMSCVYRFSVDDKNIKVKNDLTDKNILTTFITLNPEVQYGADGLVFDKYGNLYVGNFGDGAIHKVTFHSDGTLRANYVWAKNTDEMATTDGMCIDEDGTIYVADFSRNAIAKVDYLGNVKRVAQSPDSTGAGGELDQPGEPVIWGDKLIISCFDMVTDDGKINSKHDSPQTLAYILLNELN